ncbi:class I SAM-dependent methyltransferase [Paenibacillus sp. OSY-SE]|uniref:class I SAM-dependent methyltransferase n=1 Tax=Paenibacillus sp. OSY-SE TaxID=1196323 RepID=UPI0002F2F7A8|nr:class I SAM-dependent methyltransferase [Paenibacillus sp. OSY-SE]
MAKLNLDYYEPSTDDIYSDGNIESELLQYAINADCDWYRDGRWPVVYHMSHLRHNILNWFPFRDKCSILEIGAGCGALTGLLCELGAKVVAVELTKRRAEVNYQRHKHFENLEIVVCDVQKIPLEWKFDYIIINGVLEYAAYMVKSEQPYVDFLKLSAKHMNAEGRILLSIENRLGLKYFSGSREDHTGKFFSGINGYADGEQVRTFSRAELDEQVSNAQLYPLKYYHPFPDYKFPVEIYTDATICDRTPTVPDNPMDMSRVKLFEEKKVYESLMKLGVIDKFSNSFLVEIAASPEEEPANISYVKISANRNQKFQICTYFDTDKRVVYKKALWPVGKEHLYRMEHYSNFEYGNSGLKNIGCQQKGDSLSFPFITADSLEGILLKACKHNDTDKFFAQINDFREVLFEDIPLQKQPISASFEDIFGQGKCHQELRWKDNANVDMISGNIFVQNDGYQVIDYEWHVACKVPMEFLIWRMLKQFAEEHTLSGFLTKPTLYDLIGINEQTEECFLGWESHFISEYVGMKEVHHLTKDIVPIDIEQAVTQQMKENVLQSSLFFDLGNGFSDVNYETSRAVYTSTGFVVAFSQEKLREAKTLRWDPLEGRACCIQIQKVETDGIFTDLDSINAERYTEDIGYEFFTFDPQFQLSGDFSNATYLKIYFSCRILDWTVGYHKREEELYLSNKKVAEQELINIQLQTKLEEQVLKKQQLLTEINDIQKLNSIKKAQLEEKETELESIQSKLMVAQEEMQVIKKDFNQTKNNLDHIMTEMKEHRVKTMMKILLFGGITRGGSSE